MIKDSLNKANESLVYRNHTIKYIRTVTENINSLVETFRNGQVDSIPFSTNEWVLATGWFAKLINIVGKEFDIYKSDGIKGAILPPHSHRQQETIIVVSGVLRVVYESGEVFILKQSDSLVIPPHVTHCVTALENCELTILYHPPITQTN